MENYNRNWLKAEKAEAKKSLKLAIILMIGGLISLFGGIKLDDPELAGFVVWFGLISLGLAWHAANQIQKAKRQHYAWLQKVTFKGF